MFPRRMSPRSRLQAAVGHGTEAGEHGVLTAGSLLYVVARVKIVLKHHKRIMPLISLVQVQTENKLGSVNSIKSRHSIRTVKLCNISNRRAGYILKDDNESSDLDISREHDFGVNFVNVAH